jgi:hypothetical protein
MAGVDALEAETAFGSIKVVGGDVTDCRITARIFAQGRTSERARELVEQMEIKAETIGRTLAVSLVKPKTRGNCCAGADLDIILPRQTGLGCVTSYGSIKVAHISGDVTARTSFSNIKANDVEGSLDLKTSFGRIKCRDITSPNISAKSSFGDVDIVCSAAGASELSADVCTSYGNIEFTPPPGFCGVVDLRTSFGDIKTDLPVTVRGSMSKDRIVGAVGDEGGKLRLRTSFGSIKIR